MTVNFLSIMQAIKVLNMIKLYGKPIRVNKVSSFESYFGHLLCTYMLKCSDIQLYNSYLIFFSFALLQASQDKKSLDVGANLFVGNLDPVSFVLFLFSTLY